MIAIGHEVCRTKDTAPNARIGRVLSMIGDDEAIVDWPCPRGNDIGRVPTSELRQVRGRCTRCGSPVVHRPLTSSIVSTAFGQGLCTPCFVMQETA